MFWLLCKCCNFQNIQLFSTKMSLLRWWNDEENDAQNGFKEWGGYMQAKQAKLQQQFTETTNTETIQKSTIFNGIAIFVNGLTNPPATELKTLMSEHGGTFHLYQTHSTTHIIASNLPNVKINKLGSVPIVKPAWITDSLTLGKLLDYRRYLLYTNQSSTQPKLKFTASDPNFLQEFYGNSRLHLIATLGAEFKQFVADLRANPASHTFSGLAPLKKRPIPSPPPEKVIMHIDMDCFFVSVALKTNPHLVGLPLAITHARNAQLASVSKERTLAVAQNMDRLPMRMEHVDEKSSMSEIACASYEARRFGVKNGMFLGAAAKLCPNLKTLPYNFHEYRQVSHQLYQTMANFTLDIEAVSCDEMYIDCTAIIAEYDLTVAEWALHVRQTIKSVTGCPCSTGFGSNRFLARMATKNAKPDGWYHLKSAQVAEYLSNIELSQLPGVGHATLAKLTKLGLKKCGDLSEFRDFERLKRELGAKLAQTIYNQAVRGEDGKELNFSHERKSVSAEINYGIRFKTSGEAMNFLQRLCDEAWQRLSDIQMRSKCVTLKLMARSKDAPVETAKYLGHGICDTFSKSQTTAHFIEGAQEVFKLVKALYNKLGVEYFELRGVGVQLSKLEKGNAKKSNVLNRFLAQKVQQPKEIDGYFKESKKFKQQKIDFDVLNALPDELKSEIIKEYKLDTEDHLDTVENGSVFDGMQWRDVKLALIKWMECKTEPNQIDVDMLGKYFEQLAIEREIQTIQTAFNFLYRQIDEELRLGHEWHLVYFSLMNWMQSGMVARYGTILKVQRHFQSCLECLKSID